MQHRTLEHSLTAAALLAAGVLASAQVEVGPPIQLDTGRGPAACNETTIAASPANPLELVAAWNDRRAGGWNVGAALSLDGGASWTEGLLALPATHSTNGAIDPITAADPRTGTLWVGGMAFVDDGGPFGNTGIFVARKEPGAASFRAPVMACVETGVGADKPWMAAGPAPGDPFATRLYVAYKSGLIRSEDMGESWSTTVPLGVGFGFLPRVGPGGELYICYWDQQDGVKLWRSFDGGASLDGPIDVATRMDWWLFDDSSRFPGGFPVLAYNALAVDPADGTLYVVYFDTTDMSGGNHDIDLYLTRSTDRGASWSVPTVVNGDADPPGDQFMPWLEVDETGRLHLVFYDTRDPRQDDADSTDVEALVHAYYAYSDDRGASWSEERLTRTPMNSRSSSGGTFIGHYLGLATAGGRTHPVYMSTPEGSSDIFVHTIEREAIASYCHGSACPCGNDDRAAGCGNAGSDGDPSTGATLLASGSASVAADDLVLAVGGLAPGSAAILFAGRGQLRLPFGDGLRCVAPPVFRYPPRAADGGGALAFGPGEVVSHASAHFGRGGQVRSGDGWNYQVFYRDAGGPCGSGVNTTDAVSVRWR